MTEDEKNKAPQVDSEIQQETPPTLPETGRAGGGKLNFLETKRQVEDHDAREKAISKYIRGISLTALIVFVVGLFLTVAGERFGEYLLHHGESVFANFWGRLGATLIKEIGTGLIVSGIAVFGYEHLRTARGDHHQKEMMDGRIVSLQQATNKLHDTELLQANISALSTQIEKLENDLVEAVQSNIEMHTKMENLHTKLTALSEGNFSERCNEALDLLFGENKEYEGGKAFCESMQELVMTAINIKKADSNRPDVQQYLRFLGWLIKRVPNSYATAFSLYVSPDRGLSSVRDIPSASSMASELLSGYMSFLKDGDEYLAVSNILSWDAGEWPPFRAENAKACRRGVKSRRIFNLCSCNWKEDKLDLTPSEAEEARRRIANHLRVQTEARKNFEIRFFGPRELAEVTKVPYEAHRFRTTAFGLFLYHYNGVKKAKIIKAEEEAVSTLTFDDNVRFYHDTFERMWEKASPDNPFI